MSITSKLGKIEVERCSGLNIATVQVDYNFGLPSENEMVRVSFIAPYIENRMFNNKYAPMRMIIHTWTRSVEISEPERFGDFNDDPRRWVEEFYLNHTNEEAPFSPMVTKENKS